MGRVVRSTIVFLFAAVMVMLAYGQTGRAGSKDYPGLSRMPGYYISEYKDSQFDAYTFTVSEGNKEKKQSVEGHLYKITYRLNRGTTPASALQIIRNFQAAARSAGGQVLWETGAGNDRSTTVRFTKGGSEVWVEIRGWSGTDKVYFLTIVEQQAMKQDITLDAAGMASDIADSGRVAIYGIYFDTARSDVKTESEPALVEISKLLKQKPALKVYIVGHTDMVGDAASNLKRSQARAQSVVNALVTKYGIAGRRMVAFGVGPYAPVASNRTDEGRAKNRRVELVEIATR
jgi:OOP family OmpA-OmpF porin